MLTLPSAVIGQNYGQTSNFQVSSRLTFKFYEQLCYQIKRNFMVVNVTMFMSDMISFRSLL